eukprot:TRINITY_DN23625_c0_g1_i1.p1 TRINITY_DN23625_c0_g1~~TRINITY_DN23625_c0_g1_i1.p1  ORF type:complete len:181 (-),score=21.98 TRINITY_DN23625_c0_g1_i1:63-605(-)
MIRRPPRSTLSSSSAASDVYKRQVSTQSTGKGKGGGISPSSLCSILLRREGYILGFTGIRFNNVDIVVLCTILYHSIMHCCKCKGDTSILAHPSSSSCFNVSTFTSVSEEVVFVGRYGGLVQSTHTLHTPLYVPKECIHSVSYTHLRAHETPEHLVCRLLLEKKKKKITEEKRIIKMNTR